MTAPLLRLVGAEGRRGDFHLGPIDLEVRGGDRVALLGPNGAGKSTLLALAVGELAPVAGTVRLGDGAPRALPRDEVARRVSLLRQVPDLAFELSVLDVVLHGRWAHLRGLRFPGARDVALAREALACVGLAGFEGRDLGTLSGGERQRALIARSLIQGSPLLLLDEPTSSLDLGHRVDVHDLLRDLPSGGGLLLVTHDLELAAASCDRALLLNGGHVVAAGPLEDVFTVSALEAAFGRSVRVDRQPGTGHPRVSPLWDRSSR